MMLRGFPRPNHATVVSYLALFVALGGSAYAVKGTSSPVIHACYPTSTGALRLTRSGHCARGERSLSWDQKGPRGPRGSQGPSGIVDTSQVYTKTQSDVRYLPIAGTSANSSELGGQPPSAFAQSSQLRSVVTTSSPVTSAVGWNVGASAQLLANKLASTDANNAFQINGAGTISWGPGGSGMLDNSLSRAPGGTALQTPGGFHLGIGHTLETDGITSYGANLQINQNSGLQVMNGGLFLSQLGTAQTTIGLWAGVGAPNNALGHDDDIFFRGDGGPGATIYQKRSGSWVGIV
jgi:hypothetical protein